MHRPRKAAAARSAKVVGRVRAAAAIGATLPTARRFFGQLGTTGGKAGGALAAALPNLGVKPVDPVSVAVPPQYPDIPEIRAKIAEHLGTVVLTDHAVGELLASFHPGAGARTHREQWRVLRTPGMSCTMSLSGQRPCPQWCVSPDCEFGPDRARRFDAGGVAQSTTPYGRLKLLPRSDPRKPGREASGENLFHGRLKADGQWENTVVFLFSDHGSDLPRGKEYCYAEGLHVPLIIAAPGLKDIAKPGTRRSDIASLIDVAATSLALAGLDIPDFMDAKNLFAPGYRRQCVFSSQDRMSNMIDRVRSVIGDRFHYIRNFMTDRPLYSSAIGRGWVGMAGCGRCMNTVN